MDVILSIKPKYVDAILKGVKKYEFRKAIFKNKNIDNIYIYSSSPVKKIVASFKVKSIVEDDPNNLWGRFKEFSGLNDTEFFNYFIDNGRGFAIEIDNLEKFKNPIDPKEIIPGFVPPQSFCYIDTPMLPRNNSRRVYRNNIRYRINLQNTETKTNHQSNLSKYL